MHRHFPKTGVRRWFSASFLSGLFLSGLFLSSLLLCLWLGQPALSQEQRQTPDPQPARPLVQQGVDAYQQGNFQEAIAHWETALSFYQNQNQNQNNPVNTAIVLENLARTYQTLGKTSEAIDRWEQGIALYRQMHDLQQMGRLQTEQAQTYSQMGQYRQAIALLCGSLKGESACVAGSTLLTARAVDDPLGETAALGSLGEAHRLRGDYELAIAYLEAARQSQGLQASGYESAVLNSLGNAYVNQAQVSYRRAYSARQIGEDDKVSNALRNKGNRDNTQALGYFQQSLALAEAQNDRAAQLRSLLNAIPAAYRTGKPTDQTTAVAQTQQSIALLNTLPDSQAKVYATLDLARLLEPISADVPFSRVQCFASGLEPQARALLQQAVAVAERIGDRRSQSFALGELGHFYECRKDLPQAAALTQQARAAAEREPDSLYLWEWQAGRILKANQQPEAAIPVYDKALKTLEALRKDILSAKQDIQLDFRDTIEPVYREAVELRLKQDKPSVMRPIVEERVEERDEAQVEERDEARDNLNATLETLDSLKLAELQNYFGNDCAVISLNDKDNLKDLLKSTTATAFFSSVILDDRTAIVVRFPNGQQQFEWIQSDGQFVDKETLTGEINTYRKSLEERKELLEVYQTQQAQKIYGWVIAPFAQALEQTETKTLIFVQDGILRSVPMAALHDGEKFLIEKYAIATTPSLPLTRPQPLERRGLKVLALGLTQAATLDGQMFPALTNVNTEIQAIERIFPQSKPLLDQDFTSGSLQQELDKNDYPIIHIATHGEFGTEPEKTFLVTGGPQRLTLNKLDGILRSINPDSPIELLSLTACKTAVGDDRAALGLAGVAAQAGAKSVLASLWSINDSATSDLVDRFYSGLQEQPLMTKAEALQQAQRSLLKDNPHPYYWAAFTLIGNWQ